MSKPITGKTHIGERREKRPNGDIYIYERVTAYDEKTKKTDNSLWGKVLGLSNVAQWGISKVDATYHEKVLGFIKGLPTNKKEHDGLVGDLIHLLRRNEELALLHDEYQAAQTWKEKVTIRGYIVAKKAQITTRKALIDQRIIILGSKSSS